MRSTPGSPSYGLQGASRITGGFARGHAQGNVFNFADVADVFGDQQVRPKMGKVYLYTSMGDPATLKPVMSLKHDVSATLGPILIKLAKRYTGIDSRLFIASLLYHLKIYLEFNACVWVYEDEIWDLKGQYKTAIEEDEEVQWVFKNNVYILMILVVCFEVWFD
jgi:hypothetical protein